MSPFVGSALVVVSSISFGSMAFFARLAYAAGVDPVTLLFLRFAIAATVMGVVVLARREPLPRPRVAAGLAAMGGVGYVGQSLAFFTALTMANPGLVALLLYLYPALVAVLAALFLGERLSVPRTVAVGLALAGTALTVGPHFSGRPAGVILGLAAALIYSVYILAGTRLLRDASPLSGSLIIITAAAIVFGCVGAVRGMRLPGSSAGWVGVAGVAIVATVVAVTTFLVGLQAIGPTKASLLSTFEPVTTVVLAALLIGEPIGAWSVAGGVLILSAAVILARSRKDPASRVARPAASQ